MRAETRQKHRQGGTSRRKRVKLIRRERSGPPRLGLIPSHAASPLFIQDTQWSVEFPLRAHARKAYHSLAQVHCPNSVGPTKTVATSAPMRSFRSSSKTLQPVLAIHDDAWVRVSFAHTRVSIVGWIYDPDHSLPPGMYVDAPHLDCLLVAAPITLEGLDHLILKPKQVDGITAVYVDVVFGHRLLPLRTMGAETRRVTSGSPLDVCFFHHLTELFSGGREQSIEFGWAECINGSKAAAGRAGLVQHDHVTQHINRVLGTLD